jgi:hypothetical protein
MPEQDYVTIPNQPGVAGSPTGAQIAADDLSGVGTGPFVQQMSITNLAASLRALLQELSVLGLAQDPATGRLRVLLDSITGNLTLSTISTVSNVTTVATVTNLTQISGFGPGNTLVTAAHYMPADIMMNTWANAVRANIT